MGARTIHQALEETYDILIPRKSGAIKIGLCFAVTITIAIIMLFTAVVAFVLLHCSESDQGLAGSNANLSSVRDNLNQQNRILKTLSMDKLFF